MPWPSAPARERCRTSSCPRPTRRISTRRAPRRCTPRSGLGRACGAYDFAGSSRSAVGALAQAFAAGRCRGSHHAGRRVGSADRPGRLGRGARQRRRRGGVSVRARRRRGGADRPRRGERRVPGPLAGARRVGLARLGGALRRGDVRAAGPRGLRGGAEGRRPGRGRRRPRHRDRPARPGGQGGDQGARRARRGAGTRPGRVGGQPRRGPGRGGAVRRARAGPARAR